MEQTLTTDALERELERLEETVGLYDHDGCGFGRVTRERLDRLDAMVIRLETKLNALLLGVSVQLLAFAFAVVIFLLYRK